MEGGPHQFVPGLGMVKATPFLTGDSVSFEKRGAELCGEDGLILSSV